jgi:hypothetical protein
VQLACHFHQGLGKRESVERKIKLAREASIWQVKHSQGSLPGLENAEFTLPLDMSKLGGVPGAGAVAC